MMATTPETLHDVSERISAHQRSCSVNLRWALGILAAIATAAIGNYVSVMQRLEALSTRQSYMVDTLVRSELRDDRIEERVRNVEQRLHGRPAP